MAFGFEDSDEGWVEAKELMESINEDKAIGIIDILAERCHGILDSVK